MAMPLLVTTMLGSGMRSFAGSVPLRRNKHMRGNRRGRSTRPGSGMRRMDAGTTVTGIIGIVTTTATGIAGNWLT